jgi:putative FmdB family regulatory protein
VPIFDWKCIKCGNIEEHLDTSKDAKHVCSKCGAPSIKLFPSTFNFRLIYDPKKDKISWGAEGYSRSQYWDDVNAKNNKDRKIQVQVP